MFYFAIYDNLQKTNISLFVLQRDEYYDFTAMWYAGDSVMYAATSSGMSTVVSDVLIFKVSYSLYMYM